MFSPIKPTIAWGIPKPYAILASFAVSSYPASLNSFKAWAEPATYSCAPDPPQNP